MDSTFILLLFAISLILGGVILVVIVKKDHKQLDQQKYRSNWLKIEGALKKDQPNSYHIVTLNADKLLDAALKESGYKGQTMGERMRSAKDVFSNRNAVWSAHKLRNQIAHETDVQVDYNAARRALASFKQALKDVGAI